MEPNFVTGIDPELTRALIIIGLVATVGALLISMATVVISIHIAMRVYRNIAGAGRGGNRERPKWVTVSSGPPADLSAHAIFP